MFAVSLTSFSQKVSAQAGSNASEDALSVSETDADDFDLSGMVAEEPDTVVAKSVPRNSGIGFGDYVRMVVVLAVMVGAIFFLFRFIKKSAGRVSLGSDDDTFLRLIGGVSLGQGKSVQIVIIMDKAYLIGVGEQNISLIAEINDKELINAMNIYADKKGKTARPKSFADVLDLFMPRGTRARQTEGGNVFESPESEKILASIKNQKEKIDNLDNGQWES